METISLKIDGALLKRMNKSMTDKGYSTKTEYIREAIRTKLEEDEKEELIREFMNLRGKFKGRSDNLDLEKVRKETGEELKKMIDKRFN